MAEMQEAMIEFSKSKTHSKFQSPTNGKNGETQRLRFASKARFYSMTGPLNLIPFLQYSDTQYTLPFRSRYSILFAFLSTLDF